MNVWPSDEDLYQTYIAGSGPVRLNGYKVTQLTAMDGNLGADRQRVADRGEFEATNTGRALLLLAQGDPQESPMYFQFVKSVDPLDPEHLHGHVTAEIGEPITRDFGLHDDPEGGPSVLGPAARYCPRDGYYDPATRKGPIIPANTYPLVKTAYTFDHDVTRIPLEDAFPGVRVETEPGSYVIVSNGMLRMGGLTEHPKQTFYLPADVGVRGPFTLRTRLGVNPDGGVYRGYNVGVRIGENDILFHGASLKLPPSSQN